MRVRPHEFGVRLAVGLAPRDLLMGVLLEGAVSVAARIAAAAADGYAFAALASSYFENMRMPGAASIVCAAAVLGGAAILASLMPAARFARRCPERAPIRIDRVSRECG